MDRVEFLTLLYSEKFSTFSAKRLVKAIRSSTTRQYQSQWKRFQEWLPAETTDITHDTALRFLTFLHEEKHLKAMTIRNVKAALRKPLYLAFGVNTTSEEFQELSKSQFLSDPPAPKPNIDWSLDAIFKQFESRRFRLPRITTEDLLIKCLFLTALASGNRASELANASRSGCSISPTDVSLSVLPGFIYKNQSVDRCPPPISFPTLGGKHALCPAYHLKEYLKRTTSWEHGNRVFLEPKSHKPLNAGRCSFWLAHALRSFGDSPGNPSGHDIRRVSHSIAWMRNVSMEKIMRNGFWSTPNVFIRCYQRTLSVPKKQFVAGRTVIN